MLRVPSSAIPPQTDTNYLQCFPFGDMSADCCAFTREGSPCTSDVECRGAMVCDNNRCTGDSGCSEMCLLNGNLEEDCCILEMATGCRVNSDCLGRRTCDPVVRRCTGESGCLRVAEPRAEVVYDKNCICLQPGSLCESLDGVTCAAFCRLWSDARGTLHCTRS